MAETKKKHPEHNGTKKQTINDMRCGDWYEMELLLEIDTETVFI